MPLGAILRGIIAGALGTAGMTLHQEIRQRLAQRDHEPEQANQSSQGPEERDPWQAAPAPAQVGKRLIEGVLARPVSPDAIPVLTRVMHWSYGSVWGGVYAIGREALPIRPRLLGPLFGVGVWAASYAQLVPMAIYQPPWCYPLRSIADEVAYHLTYGSTAAAGYEAIRRSRGTRARRARGIVADALAGPTSCRRR